MADARRMGKSELFSHFAERFEVKRTQAREYFDELTALAEKELKRSGEFVLPGMVKLVVQKRKARMGRNPATGEAIKIPAKTVVKARIAKHYGAEVWVCPPRRPQRKGVVEKAIQYQKRGVLAIDIAGQKARVDHRQCTGVVELCQIPGQACRENGQRQTIECPRA